MATPQWTPNYFCLLSFHLFICSPVGPAEALKQVTSLQDLTEHMRTGPRESASDLRLQLTNKQI